MGWILYMEVLKCEPIYSAGSEDTFLYPLERFVVILGFVLASTGLAGWTHEGSASEQKLRDRKASPGSLVSVSPVLLYPVVETNGLQG